MQMFALEALLNENETLFVKMKTKKDEDITIKKICICENLKR